MAERQIQLEISNGNGTAPFPFPTLIWLSAWPFGVFWLRARQAACGVCLLLLAHGGFMRFRESLERTGEILQDSAAAQRYFLKTELSLVSTFIDVARGYYQRGDRLHGDRSKAQAREGIETVRRFIGTADLSPARTALFARKCSELERAVAALTGG